MKTLTIAGAVLGAGLFASSAFHGQPQSTEQPKFQVEIQPAVDGGPKFSVTNLSGKTVTACVIRFSVSSQSRSRSHMDWDAIVQGGPDSRRGGQQPLGPGATMTMYLPHEVGGALPDKVEVVAGVWADGGTFGEADWLKVILNNRASVTSAYDQAISLLQKGLDENWTRDHYLQALIEKPNSGPFYAIRSTLVANQQFVEKPQLLRHAMQLLLESFAQKHEQIRKAKPIPSVTTSS